MKTQANLVVKLFFNLSDRTFYVQIGTEMLFRVNDKIATAIQEREQIEIRHVKDINEMRIIDL